MTTNLYMVPETSQTPVILDDRLKRILKSDTQTGPTVFTRNDRDYLRGLRDAGVRDAQTILDVLDTHGAARVWEE